MVLLQILAPQLFGGHQIVILDQYGRQSLEEVPPLIRYLFMQASNDKALLLIVFRCL